MKTISGLINNELLNESRTSSSQIKDYIKSWFSQDRDSYEYTLDLIYESIMDFFKEEMDYYEEDKGKQSKEWKEVADLYKKVADGYRLL